MAKKKFKVFIIMALAIFIMLCCTAKGADFCFAANVAQIRNIAVQEFPEKDQVIITGDMPLTFHEIKAPTKIIIDIPNAQYDPKAKAQLVLNKTVKLYRGTNLDGMPVKTARIIVVLNESFPTTINKVNNQVILEIDKAAINERIEAKANDETKTQSKKGTNTLVEYHYNQGKTLARLGKWNEAVDEYLKALKIDPASEKIKLALDVAKNNLKSEKEIDKAVRFYQNGEYNEAVRAFLAITNMWPQDISAHFYLGKSYLKLNKYRETVLEFEKVMEINPDYENVKELYEFAKRRKQSTNFTVELNDQDILDVLRTILHGTGYNLMAEDGVKKKISISLVDKTLDEALNEIIIKNGFKYEKFDNTIKIMPNLPAAEDRVFAQSNLVDIEIGHMFEVLAKEMGRNLIIDPSVDRSKKTTFYIKDELTLKEIFSLLLKLNDLVAVPYYDNTYIVMTQDEARKNNKYSKKEYKLLEVVNIKPSDLKNKIFEMKLISDAISKDNITVNDDKGTITIFDTPDNIKLFESVVRQNDRKDKQVTIAVKILEVTKSAKKALGLNLNLLNEAGEVESSFPGSLSVRVKNLGKISLTKLDATLEMLESDDSVKTLASPITRVIDKQSATIHSGKTIPIKDVKQNPQYEGGKIIGYTSEETWTSAQIGITLDVKPTIHNDGEVTLDVDIKQDDADLTNVQVGSHFVTTGKNTKTMLRLKDGETIVMGGLINMSEGGSDSKVPFFSKLPILGKLFQKSTNNKSRNELIIFLTAFLVNKDDPDESSKNYEKITSDMIKY
ncbi:MAG: tetratricopeptide repeat protein [Candidatus Wallbacteria bacterium]